MSHSLCYDLLHRKDIKYERDVIILPIMLHGHDHHVDGDYDHDEKFELPALDQVEDPGLQIVLWRREEEQR